MMLRHILVGIDGSDYGEAALQYAVYLAKKLHATLHGLHVVDIVQVESPVLHDLSGVIGAAPLFNLTAQMRQNLELRGQQLLTLFRQTCDAAQVPCIEHLVTGVVPTEIIRAATDIDLILLGRGGLHTRLSKALLGSAVEGVVRRGAKPTMVTPQHYDDIRKPLLATDGSPSAMAALQVAARLALPLGLPLQVVHCTTTAEAGRPYLLEACSRLAAEGVVCDADLCLGNAHEDLAHYMRDHGHDVLFMGAFGRRRVVEWALGSTTQYLLRTCPGALVLCHAAESAESNTSKEENHS
jgi:nucleotide-binding universal stress UspA family protein